MNFELHKKAKTSQISETCVVYVGVGRTFMFFNWKSMFHFSILVSYMMSCSSIQTQKATDADFFNSFESKGSVKQNFRLDKIEKRVWELTAVEKTHGDYGLQITLNKGDKSNGKTERAEIQDAEKLDFNQEIWYRLDFKIPEDFPNLNPYSSLEEFLIKTCIK